MKELGLRHHKFSEESFEHLVNNLPTSIEKLGLVIGITQYGADKHIKTLVSRCKNLTALSLIGIQITDNTLDSLIEHLKPNMLEFRTNSPRIRHAVKVQILLTSMPKLKTLNIKPFHEPNGMTTEDIKKLQRRYPEKSINSGVTYILYMDPDQEFGTLKRPKAAKFVIRDKNFKV